MSLPAAGLRASIHAMVAFDPCLAATGVVWAPGAPDTRNPEGSSTAPAADTRAARTLVAASQPTRNWLEFHTAAGEPCAPSPPATTMPVGSGNAPASVTRAARTSALPVRTSCQATRNPPGRAATAASDWAPGAPDTSLPTVSWITPDAVTRVARMSEVAPRRSSQADQETSTIPRHRRVASGFVGDRDQRRFELPAGRLRDPGREEMRVARRVSPHREELRAVAGQHQPRRVQPQGPEIEAAGHSVPSTDRQRRRARSWRRHSGW